MRPSSELVLLETVIASLPDRVGREVLVADEGLVRRARGSRVARLRLERRRRGGDRRAEDVAGAAEAHAACIGVGGAPGGGVVVAAHQQTGVRVNAAGHGAVAALPVELVDTARARG